MQVVLNENCCINKEIYSLSVNNDYFSEIYFSLTISLFPVTCAVASIARQKKPTGYPKDLLELGLPIILDYTHNLQ